jgi:type II secretory pathway component PulJ
VKKLFNNKQGSALLTAIIFIAVLGTLAGGFLSNVLATNSFFSRTSNLQIAFNLAEAGIDKAIAELSRSPFYRGEEDTPLGEGTFTVSVLTSEKNPEEMFIISTGYLPHSAEPKAKRTVKVTIQRQDRLLAITSWQEVNYY